MLAYGVEESRSAAEILSNLTNLHDMAQGSEAERRFHRERVKNATHHIAIPRGSEWIFAPVKWCGARENSINDYPRNKSPVTDHFKPVVIKAGFTPVYPHHTGYQEIYDAYVSYCGRYGFEHSETEDARTFYVQEHSGQDNEAAQSGAAVLVNLNNVTSLDSCHITRVWGFSPEDWGALGFPKKGIANRLADEGARYFVVCFVSHNKSSHIADGDEGRVHGVYELSNEIVNLETDNVLSPSHFENDNHYIDDRFRWPFGLRAVRAWRFLNPPMTKAALPDARSKSWDVSTSIVPITRQDFDLLCQYKMEQVPVYGRPFEKPRLAKPVAIPCHVYLFCCENVAVLQGMPRWQKGDVLVKIGCTSDVRGRLASFNDDPLSRLFGFTLAHMTSDLVGEDRARSREAELLAEVGKIGRCATEATSEFYFVNARRLSSLISQFGRIQKVA